MTFTSPTQPYCRCCGKPIAKRTTTHYFGVPQEYHHSNSYSSFHVEPATTKAEAQRLLNGRIVSIRKSHRGNIIAGTWDGESYVDEFFDSQSCAAAFGRMAARLDPHLTTQAAYDAAEARKGK